MDVLKAWIHRHADHPYATEQDKRELIDATGLSMNQVSNWLIGVSPFVNVGLPRY